MNKQKTPFHNKILPMSESLSKFFLLRRLTQIALVTFICCLIIGSVSFVETPFLQPLKSVEAPVFVPDLANSADRIPVNHDVTYVIYFEKSSLATSSVPQKVLDNFVNIYADFLHRDLSAEVGHSFESVLTGFTFKLPNAEEIRKKLVALHTGALHSGDLTALLYQYLTHHAEMELISNKVELHLEKDQTVIHQTESDPAAQT